MLKPEEIRPNQLVWWTADRTKGADWDCPGIIKSVDTDIATLTIISFDDFRETSIATYGDTVQNELRITTPHDVELYLRKREQALSRGVQTAKNALEDAEFALTHYSRQGFAALAAIRSSKP